METMQTPMGPVFSQHRSRAWMIGGIIVFLVVVALGVFYMRGVPIRSSLPVSQETQTETLLQQNSSDVVSSIEQDLSATNLEGLDREVNAIDQELNAASQ